MNKLPNTTRAMEILRIAMQDELGRTGTLSDSHEVFYETDLLFDTLGIKAEYYWFWVNGGRGKTKQGGPPSKVLPKIKEWLDIKGIPRFQKKNGKPMTRDEQAWLITRKIHREGFDGNFYADKSIEKFQDLIDKAVEQDIGEYLKTVI